MPHVEGLRSCYAKVGGIVYFGRMLDKRRLLAEGKLPADYHANIGKGFDARICKFLGVDYASVSAVFEKGGSDEAMLEGVFALGKKPSEEQIYVFNGFMVKRGWRDEVTDMLAGQVIKYGLAGKPIQTFFDLIETDEGRDSAAGWRNY